jgi:hypothetical protein
VDFTSIPQTYTDLLVKVSAKSNRTSDSDMIIRFNSDSTTYYNKRMYGSGGSVSHDQSEHTNFGGTNTGSYQFCNAEYYIPDYTSARNKNWTVYTVSAQDHANAAFTTVGSGSWDGATAITSLQITDNASTFQADSTFYLYGI